MFNKNISLFFCLLLLICLTSCNFKTNNDKESQIANQSEITSSTSIDSQETDPSVNISVSEHSQSAVDDNMGGATVTTRKYRACYYDIPVFFAELVSQEDYSLWEESYVEKYSYQDPETMMIIEFIKEFDISKEDFDKANLKYAKWIAKSRSPLKNPKDFPDQELREIYDGDLIYSFDNNAINEYYLSVGIYPFEYEIEYEEAVENGEYTSQTEDWVNVEQMEAEIIAKYGSVD